MNVSKTALLLLLGTPILGLALAAPSAEAPEPDSPSTLVIALPAPVPIDPAPFLGYPEAYALHNDHVHAVVVPAISRLAFLAPTADAPNLLLLDSDSPDPTGGVGAWPAFHPLRPGTADAPPPPSIPDVPSTAAAWVDDDETQHVLLTRRYPAPVHATLVCEYRLYSGSSTLRCRQTLSRDPDAPSDAPPLALRHLTRLADTAAYRFTSNSTFGAHMSGPTLDIDACAKAPQAEDGVIIRTAFSPSLHADLRPIPALGGVELETVTLRSSPLSNTLDYTLRPAPGNGDRAQPASPAP